MNLYFYKPKQFSPLIFIICKLSNGEEYEKLEAFGEEVFQILMDMNEANETNILIFGIIKDYEKSTINHIMPSTKSSITLTNRCHNDTKFLNSVIIETLIRTDTTFYIEVTNDKIRIHQTHLNLMGLAQFYSI